MHTYIYKHKGKYYCEVIDLLGKSILKEEISITEYNNYRRTNNDGK